MMFGTSSVQVKTETLRAFRITLYDGVLARRRDSLFEITDAILTKDGRVDSLPEISLVPAFRRGHGSLYDALASGRIDTDVLEDALVGVASMMSGDREVYALDSSPYPRPDAVTLADREFVPVPLGHTYVPVPGIAYSVLARVSITDTVLTCPVSARRAAPGADRATVAAEQIRDLCARLPPGTVPLIVADAGYSAPRIAPFLGGCADLCIRLRANRALYREPAPDVTGYRGRPVLYGAQMPIFRPELLPTPDETATGTDRHGRVVRVSAWHRVRTKPADGAPMAIGSLLVVYAGASHEPLRLFWVGSGMPDLLTCARAYLARFDLEHTFRFWKNTLGWRVPALGSLAAMDRWTQVILTVHAQLVLGRGIAAEVRLPWWAPRSPDRLSLARVRRTSRAVIAIVGSPAKPPKMVHPGTGWPKGRPRTHRQRHAVVRKCSRRRK
jgi:hypothetical protein